MSKLSDQWSTPQWLFDELNKEYGPFELDPACNASNAKTIWFIDEALNGLHHNWYNFPEAYGIHETITKVWLNPPYSSPNPWIRKAKEETRNGVTTVMLLKADHSTKIYAELIYDFKNKCFYPGVERVDLPKRVRFIPPAGLINKKTGLPVKAGSPNFPSMLIIFRPVL